MLSGFSNRLSSWFAIALGCLLLNSCFETEQEFTLNPDGTGKMVLNTVFPNIQLNGDEDPTDEALQDAVAKFLKKAEGVETWRDVSYQWEDDGRIRFKGTGYFRDISKVDLGNAGSMSFAWKAADGNGTLSMDFKKDDDEDEPKKISPDPAQRAKEMKAERAKFQQSKPMLIGFLSGMKHSAVFNLPGKAGKTVNFSPGADGKLGITVTGEKMLAAMEKLVNDDDWLEKNGFDPKDGPADMNAMNEGLFGSAGAVTAERTSVGAALFDYAKEVAAAAKDFAKLQEKFTVQIGPAAGGEPFESLEVVGVRLVTKVDKKLGLRPFYQEPGYTLSVLGKFSGSVLDVTDESKVEKAVAGDGSDLLPDSDFKKRINNPKLSEDKSSVLFEIDLVRPGDDVKSIREISGTIQYKVSSGTKEVELGLAALKAGEKGKQLGAEIVGIKDGWKKGESKEMEIKLKIDPEGIQELVLVDGAKRIVLNKRGHSSFGGGPTTFTYEAEKGFPENGKLVAVVHDGVEIFDIPFKLENLSLLGTVAK